MRNARHILQRLNDRVPEVQPEALVKAEHALIRAWPWPGGPDNPPQLEGHAPAAIALGAKLVLTLRAMARCNGFEIDDNEPMRRPTQGGDEP
jgi:hypothetical protein